MNPPVLPSTQAPLVSGQTSNGEADGTRLFVATATSAGKRELPPAFRQRFTEIFVEEVNIKEDLMLVVGLYLQQAGPRPPTAEVVDFYQNARTLCSQYQLTDGAGNVPHFSMRTLVRGLEYGLRVARRPHHPSRLPEALVDVSLAFFVS
jgi:midasin (ATPase involved in ribosome maturation)